MVAAVTLFHLDLHSCRFCTFSIIIVFYCYVILGEINPNYFYEQKICLIEDSSHAGCAIYFVLNQMFSAMDDFLSKGKNVTLLTEVCCNSRDNESRLC